MKTLLTMTAAVALLAGCDQTAATFASFDQEAGVTLDQGDFGNSTMNNMMVQTGQSGYSVALGRRFDAEVESTITFAFNSSSLDAAAQDILRRQATWIKQFPEVRFKVFGHTDLVGSNAYNKRLGLARANAAVNFLVGQGISRSRLEAVASFGETRPVINTTAMERRNRRTVTEVSGFVDNHPMVLNGKYAEVIFREYVESATRQADTGGDSSSGADG